MAIKDSKSPVAGVVERCQPMQESAGGEQGDATTVLWPPLVALSLDPRETMRRLPTCLQAPVTWLTGKPLNDEKPWRLTPWHHLASAEVALVLGVGMSAGAWNAGYAFLPLLLPGWLLAVHGARKLRTVIMHQCSHTNFISWPKFDHLLGEAISIMLVAEEFAGYKREHVGAHHSAKHITKDDPTVQFLLRSVGLRPGMPVREMWCRLARTVLSPMYHARFLIARICSHFRGTGLIHRVVMTTFLASLLALVALSDAWTTFFVAWVVPVGLLYQVAAALRLSSEHVFPIALPATRDRATVADYTLGIFIGQATPPANTPPMRRFLGWTAWTTCMVFYHLPCRLFVLVGDGPAHDYHHRHPNSKNWSDYAFARREDVLAADPAWPPYREVWGLHTAIQAVFESLHLASPEAYTLPNKANSPTIIDGIDG